MTAPARGRRPGDSGTREAILAAAREQFGEHGYQRTTIRSIAAEAGVDPRLVSHYFGTKQGLFRESVAFPPAAEARVAAAFESFRDEDDPGRLAAEFIVSLVEDPQVRQVMVGLIRSASSEPEAAEEVRKVMTESKLMPFADALGGAGAPLRASFVASQIVGLVMARHVVRLGPIATATPEQVIDAIAPVFGHYLTGDWVREEMP